MIIATWNINSLRAREARVLAWLREQRPDVLCLQETKVVDAEFPAAALRELGYEVAYHGQRTYNGVAVLSRSAITDVQCGFGDGVDDPQARFMAVRTGGVRVLCAYVPNGASPDSDKYAYKLAWLARLRAFLDAHARVDEPLVLCGDFNVAPGDHDVARPEDWRDSVLFCDSARAALAHVAGFGLVDLLREKYPEGGVFSWWDYRQMSFARDDGARIDLIFATAPLAAGCRAAWVDREAREGERPSDHAPVLVELAAP